MKQPMRCQLYIRERFASLLEAGLKFLTIDVGFAWAGVKPLYRHGLKCYGSPEFNKSIFAAMEWLEEHDRLSAGRIHRSLKYVAEGLADDDFVFLRSRGVLLGRNTKYEINSIIRQLIKAAVACRLYSGFGVWTSRMDAAQARRVRRLAVRSCQHYASTQQKYGLKSLDGFH